MIEFDVDMGYLLECDELDKVVLNDENGEHEPMEFVPKDAATVGTVPETKYLMALDEAREAQRKLEICQTIQKVYQSKCRSLKETNADLRRIIGDMKAAEPCAGTLTAEQVRECVKEVYFEGYSDGATHRVNGIKETDWQAIADKLNAMLGAETCHIEVHDNLAETEGMGDV